MLLLLLALSLSAKMTLLDDLRSRFDPSPEKVKARIACKGTWAKQAATTSDHHPYDIETCPDAEQQVMTMEGKVLAVGITLVNHTKAQHAETTVKNAAKDLLGTSCKELRKEGQLSFYDCASAFSVAVSRNMNANDDTYSVTTLFGDAGFLHLMVGIK
jgi:hypothetical protein